MINLSYFVKAILCSGILSIFYLLILSKLKCFQFNRFYLLLIVALSYVIPLCTNPWSTKSIVTKFDNNKILSRNSIIANNNSYLTREGISEPTNNRNGQISKEKNDDQIVKRKNTSGEILVSTFQWKSLVWGVYLTISLLILFRFIVGLWFLITSIRKNEKIERRSFIYVLLAKKGFIPYTFGKFIFISKEAYESNVIPQEILQHEQAHALQRHSIDLIFIKICLILSWFNPFLFLLQKCIRENHEYLADQAVTQCLIETTNYQLLLLQTQQTISHFNFLTSNFNFLTIKKRFLMIQKKISRGEMYYFSYVHCRYWQY